MNSAKLSNWLQNFEGILDVVCHRSYRSSFPYGIVTFEDEHTCRVCKENVARWVWSQETTTRDAQGNLQSRPRKIDPRYLIIRNTA